MVESQDHYLHLPTYSCTTVACGESVIGFVDPPGVWLVVVNDSIACFNMSTSTTGDPLQSSKLSLPPTRREVRKLLQELLNRSRSTSAAKDHGYKDINHYLHNLTKL